MILQDGEIYAINPQFRTQLREALQVRQPVEKQFDRWDLDLGSDQDRTTMIASLPIDGVAVVRVQGIIMRDSRWYRTTWQTLIADLEFLEQRPSVSAVVLDLDTPGGVVMGCQEACDALSRMTKPVVAYVSGHAMSAGYRIACHCNKIFATASAAIGSIGTMINIVDSSKQAAAEGIEVLSFVTGPFKNIGLEGVPVTEEQRQFLQDRAQRLQLGFSASLAARGLSAQKQAEVSDGRYWDAVEALALGLIDGIRPVSEVIDGMVSSSRVLSPGNRSAGHQEGSDMAKTVSDPPAVDAVQSSTTEAPKTAPAPAASAAAASTPAPAVQSVSIDQIEQLCPGAPPAFVLQQAKTPGLTEVAVLRAFAAYQQQQIAALQENQQVDRVVSTAVAGSNNLSQSPAGGSQKHGVAGDAVAQFESAVAEAVESGMTRAVALQATVAAQPELHTQYLQACRNLTAEQVAERRQRNASRVLGKSFIS